MARFYVHKHIVSKKELNIAALYGHLSCFSYHIFASRRGLHRYSYEQLMALTTIRAIHSLLNQTRLYIRSSPSGRIREERERLFRLDGARNHATYYPLHYPCANNTLRQLDDTGGNPHSIGHKVLRQIQVCGLKSYWISVLRLACTEPFCLDRARKLLSPVLLSNKVLHNRNTDNL